MKKAFTFNRKKWMVLLCILALIVLALVYVLVYLPANESNLKARRFRTLQRVERNIQAKASNSLLLIQRLADALSGNKANTDTAKVRIYIESQFSKENSAIILDHIRRINAEDTLPELQYNRDTIHLAAATRGANDIVRLAMKYSSQSFVQPLLPDGVFDQYILMDKDGVIYESFASGFSFSPFDSLTQVASGATSATTLALPLGGVDYRLFLQPLTFNKTGKWVIIGLLSEKRYAQEKSQLPADRVMLIIIISILLLVLFPWFKLFFMGSRDRLTMADGALSFIVAMLFVSITFLLFSSIANNMQPDNEGTAMKTLAKKIDDNINNHLVLMQHKLAALDGLRQNNDALNVDIRMMSDTSKIAFGSFFNKKESTDSDAGQRQRLAVQLAANTDPSIFQLFWLNSSGQEVCNWNAGSQNAPHSNFASRNYFKEQARKDHPPFSIDQVYSWTTGTFRTVISQRTKQADSFYVACLSFSMKPLHGVVMPDGFIFAITDEAGNVLYHSDPSHNLNEFLPEEFEDSATVKSMLFARKNTIFDSRYNGKYYKVAITQASKLPYKIVLLSDQRYTDTRDTGIFSFTICMLLAFFLLVFFQLLMVVVIGSKRSALRNRAIDADWIWPRRSSHKVYLFSTYANALVLLLLILFFKEAGFVEFFFMMLLAATGITLFTNHVFAFKYGNIESKRLSLRNYKRRNLVVLYAFAIGYNFLAIWKLKWAFFISRMLGFELLVIGVLVICFYLYKRMVHAKQKDGLQAKESRYFIRSYAAMALTRLIVASGLPVFFFYQQSYNYEQLLQARFRQMNMAQQMFEKLPANQRNLQGIISAKTEANVYIDSVWINRFYEEPLFTTFEKMAQVDGRVVKALGNFRVYENNLSVYLDQLVENQTADSMFFFAPQLGTSQHMAASTLAAVSPKSSMLGMNSGKLYFEFPSLAWGKNNTVASYIFWFLLLITLVVLYNVIIMVVRRIFALDVPGAIDFTGLDAQLQQTRKSHHLYFITGLPGAGKMAFAKTMAGEEKQLVVDLFSVDQHLTETHEWKSATSIVLNHFEYVIHDEKACMQLLGWLEGMLVFGNKKVIILSTIHPSALLQKLHAFSLDADESKTVVYKEVKDKFDVLLGHFTVIIIPLRKKELVGQHNEPINEKVHFIASELGYAPMLHKLIEPAIASFLLVYNSMPDDTYSNIPYLANARWAQWIHQTFSDHKSELGDELIWKIQGIAQQFYWYIWQSLSTEEKFLVYDLAEDGLVNKSESFHLSLLLQKGLINRKDDGGQLELFNRSFKNYVLTSVSKADVMRLQQSIKDESSWNELRIPLMIVLVGVLAFLLVSQQQAYSRIVGYLSAIAALVPMLNAVLGVVKSSAAKNE